MVRVVQCCSTALLQSPPLQTVGGEDVGDLRRGHLQAPPLTGRTVARGVSPLQEGGAQPGQVRSPPLCPGAGTHRQLPHPPRPQLDPLGQVNVVVVVVVVVVLALRLSQPLTVL